MADVLLSRGMQANGEVKVRRLRDIPGIIKLVLTAPLILLGILSMTVYFGSYMASLALVDVSVANPLTALNYLVATVYAIAVMRERVSLPRGAGILCIVLGAIFVGMSS